MLANVVAVFIDLFVNVFNIILIIRIVTSWIIPDMQSKAYGRLLLDLTEPILAPVRKILPNAGMLDLAPLVTVFGLYILRNIIVGLLFH